MEESDILLPLSYVFNFIGRLLDCIRQRVDRNREKMQVRDDRVDRESVDEAIASIQPSIM